MSTPAPKTPCQHFFFTYYCSIDCTLMKHLADLARRGQDVSS